MRDPNTHDREDPARPMYGTPLRLCNKTGSQGCFGMAANTGDNLHPLPQKTSARLTWMKARSREGRTLRIVDWFLGHLDQSTF
jgi:hypothetical protein